MKKIWTLIAVSGAALLLPACNTIQGAAADVDSATDCVDGVEGNC